MNGESMPRTVAECIDAAATLLASHRSPCSVPLQPTTLGRTAAARRLRPARPLAVRHDRDRPPRATPAMTPPVFKPPRNVAGARYRGPAYGRVDAEPARPDRRQQRQLTRRLNSVSLRDYITYVQVRWVASWLS